MQPALQLLHAGGGVRWLPREDILHFEEIERLVDVFVSLGVDKVRLTGGEPLLRRGLPDLVRRLAAGRRSPTWR